MRQSQLLTKTRKEISQQEHSINAQLLERAGYISKLMAGVFSYLPLGYRVLTNIEAIVRQEMDALGAEELLMPALQPKEPWDTTGRWNTVDVLYKLKAGDRDLCLGPTHEEVVTPLAASFITSYKDLPRAVYQIQTKFRNEARPKSGVLRGREFRMKDLYSFHADEEDLNVYYDRVKQTYTKIFERCGLGGITYFTYASGGTFSKYSHEFQTITPYGEDTIFVCASCSVGINKEIMADLAGCPECSSTDLKEHTSIEVGNIFKLMNRFSEPFGLMFRDSQDTEHPVAMGCYGLGTTRLMGTIVEALHDEHGIIWPSSVAPFDIHLLQLSTSSQVQEKSSHLYAELLGAGYDVLLDDREVRPGQKFADSDLIGIPIRLVISDKTVEQKSVEVKLRLEKVAHMISQEELGSFLAQRARRS
jgi:prolyl-tRNA synthetase